MQRSISPYAMETYGEVEVWPHSCLTLTLDGSGWVWGMAKLILTLDGSGWSGLHPGHFTPLERNFGICWMEGWVGLTLGLDVIVKIQIFYHSL
jgi:hypothetical protein